MRIIDVKAIGLSYPLVKPIWDSVNYMESRNCVIVQIYTDEGLIGIGEAGHAGGPLESTITVIEKEVAPLIIGEDPFAIEHIWDKLYRNTKYHGRSGIIMHAISGIDIALWDLMGKSVGLPIYRLLGYYRERVPAYASIGFYSENKGIEELVKEANQAVSKGFSGFKIKIGRLSLKEDLSRVEAVRDTIGPDADLMVDINSKWDVPTVLKVVKLLEKFDIKWIEEPISVDDVEGTAHIAMNSSIPIAGYEQETSFFKFKDFIVKGGVFYVQPNTTFAGGISGCRKIANMAAAWNRPCYPHAFSSSVCLSANLHLLASIPNGGWLEFDQNINPLREKLSNYSLQLESDGTVCLPNRPGLGIDLNLDIVNQYKVNS